MDTLLDEMLTEPDRYDEWGFDSEGEGFVAGLGTLAIREALRRGLGHLAVRLAIQRGERDENKLSNMLFFARHPELGGRPIRKGETKLAREWLAIRDRIVRPALRATASPARGGAGRGGPPSVPDPGTPPAGADGAALSALRAFVSSTTEPTVENALRIMKLICQVVRLPWPLGYTVLAHEGGVRLFRHGDGVMQTTRGARQSVLPRIPRPLKLTLLDLPPTDRTTDARLNQALHQAFHRRLAVQIAAGVQELKTNLDRFNGYVALALTAYNTGAGWSYYMATKGKTKGRPRGVSDEAWEQMCRAAAARLHEPPSQVGVGAGQWQCDKNIPAWFRRASVRDRQTGLALIGYKYLRSIRICYHPQKPALPCNASTHKQRHPGTGKVVCQDTRAGALDKLYRPEKLGRIYHQAVRGEWPQLADDGSPLKVQKGRLSTIPAPG